MENTTENNKLLAEFLNIKEWEKDTFNINGSNYSSGALKYHFDWNWLMQVVEKIERYLYEEQATEFKIDIFSGSSIYIPKTKTHIHFPYNNSSKIQAVYNACTEFVKWYNENAAKEN